jgi:hypothetical protein
MYFDNSVESDDYMCDNNVMLEPRLIEYMKQRKYYVDNDITPDVPLEHRYGISQHDFNNIKKFLSGKKDIYGKKCKNTETKKNTTNIHYDPRKHFPSKLLSESRVPKIKKPKIKPPKNMGMFYDSRGQYYDENPMGRSTKDKRINTMLDFWDEKNDSHKEESHSMENIMNGSSYASHNDYYDQALTDDRLYNADNDYNLELNRMIDDSERQVGSNDHNSQYMKLNKYDRDFKHPEYRLSGQTHMDTDNKVAIPSMDSNKTELQLSDYSPIPYKGQGFGRDDISVETSMMHSMPTRTFKSYGYRNPAEHYFQYLDPAHGNRDESVFPFPRGGVSTRLDNKKMRRQYKREIF